MKSTRLSLKTLSNDPFKLLLHGADGTDEDGDGGKTGGAGGAAGDADTDKDKKAEPTSEQKKIAALEEEKDRHWERSKAAEKERDDALAELRTLRDKDKPVDEKVAERLSEAESLNVALQGTNQKLALENAFLKDNTFLWHNPERALALADLSKVEIDKSGKVVGMRAALEALAKSDAYLIKPKDADKDADKEEVDPKGKKPPASGGPAGGRGKPEEAAAQTQRLRSKYSALRGRTNTR